MLLAASFVLCGNAEADVGLVVVDKSNQAQRSGDRFKVSFEGRPADSVRISVKPLAGERFTRADLDISDRGRHVARIPIRAVPQGDGGAYAVELALNPEFARNCRLDVLIDSADPKLPGAGTVFRIELGSYFERKERRRR